MKKLKGRIVMSRSVMFLLALAGLALFSVAETAYAKPAACGHFICIEDISVTNQAELNAAIAAFNTEKCPCTHKTNMTADIFLTSSTMTIQNNYKTTWLWIRMATLSPQTNVVHGVAGIRLIWTPMN